MSLTYKLEAFEGPLDLLLHLIEKSQIAIEEISLSQITDQYLSYLSEVETLELEMASEFLLMAAKLLSLKSRRLLPKVPNETLDEKEEALLDEHEEYALLLDKLVKYQRYKQIAEELREKETVHQKIYTKEPEDLSRFLPQKEENPLKGLFIADLMIMYEEVKSKVVKRNSSASILRDEISIEEKIDEVISHLARLGAKGRVLFSKLHKNKAVKHEVVVTFLAVLELMKRNKLNCYQEYLFSEIVISWKEDLQQGDEFEA